MTTSSNTDFFKTNVLGHPAGLFVLFFTEMWERFSYYGMRALLVLFLTSAILGEGGWGWPRENALALYGTYTSLVYITPILGGWLADKKIGYRWAVVIGAFIMTLGHASMAIESPTFLYIGISLLIVGNGFFKPNITSIISNMYKGYEDKKDGAYTIFYMGVNAGAFLGILLCGYIGEQVGWSFGFGLAGIFMFLGMLQFYFGQGIFGDIGLKPKNQDKNTSDEVAIGNSVAFSPLHKIMMVVMTVTGLFWIFNDAFSKITKNNLLAFNGVDWSNYIIIGAVALFVLLIAIRIPQYNSTVRDRLIAVLVFAFFTIFFWASFEQAGGSMSIFARDYTSRVLEGSSANLFRVINTLVTIVPLGIISYVLFRLFKETFKKYALSNIFLGVSFIIIWGFALWMLKNQWGQENPEVPASWFSVLNSLFIIAFAPLFSKWWESKYNPSAAFKYGFGLLLLGLGFAFLAYGASGIPQGAKTASVSVMWLVFAYLFHTLGELCLSPVALSYISKLVPASMIAFMFGVWYIAIAIGNKTAGSMGGLIDKITAAYSLSDFFLIFAFVPMSIGILAMLLNPALKKLMHGVR